MGGICSKQSNYSGGHTILGSSSSAPGSRPPPTDQRAAAAEAADRRRKADERRGTNQANPDQGVLSAKVAASKSAKPVAEPVQDERVVWD